MGIIHVVAGIIHAGIGYTACGTEVFIPALAGVFMFMRMWIKVFFIIVITPRIFIILLTVPFDRLFILIFTVLQGNGMPYKFSLGTSKRQFLAHAFFIIPGNLMTFTVIIRIFIG